MGCKGTRAAELRCKEVICIPDGSRLGCVSDIELSLSDGRITALVVPGKARFWGLFGCQDEYVIPWKNICRVGDDIILADCRSCDCRFPRQKCPWFS